MIAAMYMIPANLLSATMQEFAMVDRYMKDLEGPQNCQD